MLTCRAVKRECCRMLPNGDALRESKTSRHPVNDSSRDGPRGHLGRGRYNSACPSAPFLLEYSAVKQTEILVVGAGPAGLTAGIYAARSGHKALVLEKAFAGGQMALTSEVENYPGFSEPVSGMLLAQTMEQQAIRFGCEMLNAEATGITAAPAGFEVATTAGPVAAATVIVCSGVKPKLLGVPGEKELSGRGVSYCAVCDGPLFKGREVAVIGGGDSALDEALYLSNIVARVHLIHRRDEFRACPFAQQRLRERGNVTYHLSCVVEAINGNQRVESLTIKNLKDASTFVLPVVGLDVAEFVEREQA
jgi:thioredoxin reductase (NADPH)